MFKKIYSSNQFFFRGETILSAILAIDTSLLVTVITLINLGMFLFFSLIFTLLSFIFNLLYSKNKETTLKKINTRIENSLIEGIAITPKIKKDINDEEINDKVRKKATLYWYTSILSLLFGLLFLILPILLSADTNEVKENPPKYLDADSLNNK